MTEDPFSALEKTLEEDGVDAAFDRLIEILEAKKEYPQLFEALLMKKRHQLQLPLQGTESISDLPEHVQGEVEEYYIEVCRKVGKLYLEDNNISGAWPYFRAIDEPKLVAESISKWQMDPESDDENELNQLDEVVDIALNQGANPKHGYKLVLEHYGVCRAITLFEHQFAYKGDVREHCGELLVTRLYNDLVENVRADIESRDDRPKPEEDLSKADLRGLIEGRDWLFEGFGYHVDVSHLMSVVRVAASLTDHDALSKALQMTEYGRKLGRDFQHPDVPPFEDFYNDYRIFLRALIGEGVDGAVRYFTQAADRHTPDEEGRHFPGEVLVYLLHRVGRHSDAIDAYLKYLAPTNVRPTLAPSLTALCEQAGNYSRLLTNAREREDLLQFAAGLVESQSSEPSD